MHFKAHSIVGVMDFTTPHQFLPLSTRTISSRSVGSELLFGRHCVGEGAPWRERQTKLPVLLGTVGLYSKQCFLKEVK